MPYYIMITGEQLFTAGAHVGYSRSRRNPSMVPFVYAQRKRYDIINLEITLQQIAKAAEVIAEIGKEKKPLLIVGSKPEIRMITEKYANLSSIPYVHNRWLGGTLTNFKEIKKRIDSLVDLRSRKEKGTLVYKTKKELLMIEREMARLEHNFAGIVGLDRLPAAMLVVDVKKEHIAVAEAHKLGIPVIGLMNTDSAVADAEYPIVLNDASLPTVDLVVHDLLANYNA